MHKSIGRHRRGTPGLVYTKVDWEPSNSHREGVDVATILGREIAAAPLDPTVGTVLPQEMSDQLEDLLSAPKSEPALEGELLSGPFLKDENV